MKRLRATLIALAICAASVGISVYGSFGVASTKDNNGSEQAQVTTACARCGDGVCAKSCENATTCPRDCGGGGGGTSVR
jgi:hypothetical protein